MRMVPLCSSRPSSAMTRPSNFAPGGNPTATSCTGPILLIDSPSLVSGTAVEETLSHWPLGPASAEGGPHLVDRGPLGVGHRPAVALVLGRCDALGEGEDEAAIALELLGGGLRFENRDRLADDLEVVLLQLLDRALAGAVHLRLGPGDLVHQLRAARLLARLGVGLRHREGL